MANLFLTLCWWCSSMEIIFWQTYCIDVRRGFFYGIYMISACEILSLRILKDMTISLIFSIFCLMDMTNFWINKLFILFVLWKWLFRDFFLCRNSGWSWQYWSHLARELCLHVDYLSIVLGSKNFLDHLLADLFLS